VEEERWTNDLMNECDQAGQVGRENGVDIGFETPLSSHHIGIGTKLCCRFEFSVVHYIFIKSTALWCTTKINKIKTKSQIIAFSVCKENLCNVFSLMLTKNNDPHVYI